MTSARVATVATVFALLAGCGGDNSAESAEGGASVASRQAGNPDRCALLTDAEVTDAIGPNDGGRSGEGMWGNMGCRWTATRVQEVSGLGEWRDAIEVALFDAMRDQWARDEAQGEPVAGFVDGALYDESYGDLWFPCAGGRVCVVKARTASSDRREEIATRLARLVEGRL